MSRFLKPISLIATGAALYGSIQIHLASLLPNGDPPSVPNR